MSLVNCVRNILANIENNGLDIPAVSGSKGEFPMYNLMGSQVATVNLGYRMFSFGLGITGHVNLSLSKGIKQLEIKENILTELSAEQPGKQNGQCKPPSLSCRMENGTISDKELAIPDIVEVHRTPLTNAHTQTDNNISTKQHSATPLQRYDNPESFSIHHHNNISRPPPLYYNSTSTFTKPRVTSVFSGYKNSDNELTNPKIISTSLEKSVKDTNVKINSQPQYCDISVQTSEMPDNVPGTQRKNVLAQGINDNQLGLPVIEALLNELLLLRTKCVNNDLPQQLNEGATTSTCENKQAVKIYEAGRVPMNKAQDKKMKTERVPPKTRRVALPGPKKSVPTRASNKGVLLSRHPIKFKKSSLKYGTTKTQKLREAFSKGSTYGQHDVVPADSQIESTQPEKEECPRQSVTEQRPKVNKSTMKQNDELDCKDIGIQVRISDDEFTGGIAKHQSEESLLDSGGLNNVILGMYVTYFQWFSLIILFAAILSWRKFKGALVRATYLFKALFI
jgi:hypothetical protein